MVKCERTYQGLLFVKSPFQADKEKFLECDGGKIEFDCYGGNVDFAECVKARFSFEWCESVKK